VSDKAAYALLIYRSSEGEITEARATQALEGHRALQRGAAADLHAVARLDGVEGAKTVVLRGSAHEITDGPYIETKEWLVGFYLLDCANMNEALAHARTICSDDVHVIEVRPVSWRGPE